MVSIRGYGSYVPLYRIERSTIAEQYGERAGGGETAVPAHDENVTTLGVQAAKNALSHAGVDAPDAVYAATTSDDFDERGVAAHVAYAVGADGDARVSDFQGSARAATNAVLAARDTVEAGRAETALVVASDVLTADAGTRAERTAGAGAGALVLGTGDGVADLRETAVATTGFVGRFAPSDGPPETGDGRFNRERYLDAVTTAVNGLDGSFDRAALPAPDGRWASKAAGALDLDADLDSTFDAVGFAGAGGVLLDLATGLDAADAGDTVLVAGYGPGGCDALSIDRTTDGTPEMTTDDYIESKEHVPYGKHRGFRGGAA
ncbi:hydroxymethylglutaryl-CoA synthase family protein [Salarchaeum sp. JOR-1]|uniref:hydroxymethylglutaryl-CoA synthase family protein n=1 Tax=Salarchaeum sp. JOR-1 TaxID=2599399 RepID=UPI0011987EC5|nr:hydroxymethylglutaryl-CoA synthase family protein [Salarchaeum sp. JOR-1]QDX40944.1 hydroxymethylglutaryl-CoA synthase family protein [Salarchaeum sp. JOR-1]